MRNLFLRDITLKERKLKRLEKGYFEEKIIITENEYYEEGTVLCTGKTFEEKDFAE